MRLTLIRPHEEPNTVCNLGSPPQLTGSDLGWSFQMRQNALCHSCRVQLRRAAAHSLVVRVTRVLTYLCRDSPHQAIQEAAGASGSRRVGHSQTFLQKQTTVGDRAPGMIHRQAKICCYDVFVGEHSATCCALLCTLSCTLLLDAFTLHTLAGELGRCALQIGGTYVNGLSAVDKAVALLRLQCLEITAALQLTMTRVLY